MDKKRTSQQIDTEMQGLRGKVRALEAEKQEHVKALETAKRERKKSAYAAHSEKNPRAKERLTKAHTAQREAELALEDLEGAIVEGRAMFEQLEHEWKTALREEEWQAILALAEEAQKEAEQIDGHMEALSKFLGQHQGKLEELKGRSHNLGVERGFGTTGVRHAFRRLNWLLIKSGASSEVEKPSEVYRQTNYAAILAQQIEAAKKIAETQPNREDGGGRGAEGNGQDQGEEVQAEAEPGPEAA
ncbi:MAG: hypothetical protein HYY46_23160 [Deltaproteobacteria bacterium]|nr:hypothetical protein [Deltaproteobacteria bacterium]